MLRIGQSTATPLVGSIVKRGGVIGINLFDRFLLSEADYAAKRRATLSDVVAHVKHICDLVGSDRHVGLGTDIAFKRFALTTTDVIIDISGFFAP